MTTTPTPDAPLFLVFLTLVGLAACLLLFGAGRARDWRELREEYDEYDEPEATDEATDSCDPEAKP